MKNHTTELDISTADMIDKYANCISVHRNDKTITNHWMARDLLKLSYYGKEKPNDAIAFEIWREDNGWQCIYSEKLKKKSYVNCPVMVHGSDEYFTDLIKKQGTTLEELYELFKKQK